MFCTKCGVVLAGVTNFCGNCGNPVASTNAAQATAPASPAGNLVDKLPVRLEKALTELLETGENVRVKLKGAFKEALICTDERVLILKAGFMTGQFFGSNVFQSPYRNITGVQVKKHLITGYFELSAGGVSNQPTSYWESGRNSPERRENCIAINSPDAFRKFRAASSFILSKVG